MDVDMNVEAAKWERSHTGHVTNITSYSFDFVEVEWDGEEQTFKEKKKYSVMKSYFFSPKKLDIDKN